MSKSRFFLAGVYDDVADADADYERIKALHGALAAMEQSAQAG
jgi:hypothetical protein